MIRFPLCDWRLLLAVAALLSVVTPMSMRMVHADEGLQPLDAWPIPDYSGLRKFDANAVSKSTDTALTRQLETRKSFHEVVAFYLDKAGVDWRDNQVLSRRFPTAKASAPAVVQQTNGPATTTVLYRIGQNSAICHFTVTGLPDIGTLSVSISRSRRDDTTFVQMIQLPWPEKKVATATVDR